MTTDTARLDATATMVPVPVITSGAEAAIRTAHDLAAWIAVDPAIAQVPHGHFLLVDTLPDALPNHGQI